MGKSIIETFDRARSFLASRGFARNLRLADVLAVRQYAAAATPPNVYWHSYRDTGGAPGPLDAEGNMPSSSSAFILGTFAFFDASGAPDDDALALSRLAASGQHVVRVAGTDVLTVQLGRELTVPGQFFADDQTNNFYGTAQGARVEVEPTPPLFVGPGERVQQGALITVGVTLNAAELVRLGLTLLVADQGTD